MGDILPWATFCHGRHFAMGDILPWATFCHGRHFVARHFVGRQFAIVPIIYIKQGCQIFLGTIKQKVEKPNYHKIYQMVIKIMYFYINFHFHQGC
jgi:hypothetical protein